MEMIVIVNETEERNRVYCGKVCSSEFRIMMLISGLPSITSLVKMKCLLRFKIKDIIHNFYI
jgi:hypothetical protein